MSGYISVASILVMLGTELQVDFYSFVNYNSHIRDQGVHMNNETIVCPNYGHAIDSMLCVYGGASLIAVILAIHAVIANV